MTMPPGKYYIGDLAYVLHDRWDEFCDITISGNECLDGEFQFDDGTKFAVYRVAHGNGLYVDEFDNVYMVDTGSIGCISVNDISEAERANIDYGNVFDFNTEFDTESHHGIIHFGNVSIDAMSEDQIDEDDNFDNADNEDYYDMDSDDWDYEE